jgi:NTE family protein
MSDLTEFLKTSPIFEAAAPEELDAIAPLLTRHRHKAGSVVLGRGAQSDALYFVYSGRMAVRIQREDSSETLGYLQPPDTFGELSFVTGRPCARDVEADVDAEVLRLSRESVTKLPGSGGNLMRAVVGRLQDPLTRAATAAELSVIVLRNHPNWEAPQAFAAELARSLARQTNRETLLVHLSSAAQAGEVRRVDDRFSVCVFNVRPGDAESRSALARQLADWKREFQNVILNKTGTDAAAIHNTGGEFANWLGELLGPGDPVPDVDGPNTFIVQSAERPTLPLLNGGRQLIYDAAAAEAAHNSGTAIPERFRRTADSIARCVARIQVGLALGGGAAWGWAHIGVLSVLEEAGLPIDMICGCSMGSVIGALHCAGYSVKQLIDIANHWRTRTRRFIEWRFWRMALLNEKRLCRVFRRYFGDRLVNQAEIPFWANAVDIQTGKEIAVQSGSLVECVRASVAMPGLLPPVNRKAHLLVDASIMDPVPVRLLRGMGCHFAIGVNALAKFESQRINTHYPFNAFDVMSRCVSITGHEIGQARAEQAADIVFTPALGDITMLQFSRSAEIIERGRKTANEHLPAILASYERMKQRATQQPPPT